MPPGSLAFLGFAPSFCPPRHPTADTASRALLQSHCLLPSECLYENPISSFLALVQTDVEAWESDGCPWYLHCRLEHWHLVLMTFSGVGGRRRAGEKARKSSLDSCRLTKLSSTMHKHKKERCYRVINNENASCSK